jgi:hypothetical protein
MAAVVASARRAMQQAGDPDDRRVLANPEGRLLYPALRHDV